MSLKKDNAWRSRKYLNAAEGQACVRCGVQDGTIVACHYSGWRQHALGKGMRIKCSDIATADLCLECHEHMDGYKSAATRIERSEEFLHCILLTIIRRLAGGVLK